MITPDILNAPPMYDSATGALMEMPEDMKRLYEGMLQQQEQAAPVANFAPRAEAVPEQSPREQATHRLGSFVTKARTNIASTVTGLTAGILTAGAGYHAYHMAETMHDHSYGTAMNEVAAAGLYSGLAAVAGFAAVALYRRPGQHRSKSPAQPQEVTIDRLIQLSA